MLTQEFENRIQGCLLGCAIGAEFGFARRSKPEMFAVKEPKDVLDLKLEPAGEVPEDRSRVDVRRMIPFVGLGVRTYLAKGGRATPEDFAAQLKDDPEIAGPVFSWDGVHTIQELLKEGMQPRITGLGTAPSGLIAAAMPAVGIYHFADPEYAYLDGVELASVAQPELGADWAALCAVAIACALEPEADAGKVVESVLKIALRHNKEIFYQLNQPTREADWRQGDKPGFCAWWLNDAGRGENRKETVWIGSNPIRFVLPLLKHFSKDARQIMNLVLAPNPPGWLDGWLGGHCVSAIIAGGILGALHGPDVFPTEWRSWAEPIAEPWYPLAGVVGKRLEKESAIISETELLAEKSDGISRLHDKVYGCMLAGAIGNAMGSPVENRLYWEIDKEHPGGITTILEPSRLESEDDNQMAMLLVETYLEREGLPVMARHFGQMWKDRLNRDHFFPLCMGNAYDLILRGWDSRIIGHWSVVTGSTVMCMEPVGVFHAGDPEYAAIDGTAISYMYQRGLDVITAASLSAAVAEALRPNASVESVLQAALEASPRSPLKSFDDRPFASAYDYLRTCLEVAGQYDDVLEARKELYEKCLLYHSIDPLELWGLSLAMFKIADGDVRQAAIGGTNIGRDSDTISGRAAMLSGALNGAGSVPEDWLRLFKPEVLERIKRNAGRFADLVVAGRLGRLKDRQAAATATGTRETK